MFNPFYHIDWFITSDMKGRPFIWSQGYCISHIKCWKGRFDSNYMSIDPTLYSNNNNNNNSNTNTNTNNNTKYALSTSKHQTIVGTTFGTRKKNTEPPEKTHGWGSPDFHEGFWCKFGVKTPGFFQVSTPLKINMEHNHGGLVQIIFLTKLVICRFQPLIFRGVCYFLFFFPSHQRDPKNLPSGSCGWSSHCTGLIGQRRLGLSSPWLNGFTPWKFNIAPENIPSQKESSLPTIIFQGLC